jgi:hypothetical protein
MKLEFTDDNGMKCMAMMSYVSLASLLEKIRVMLIEHDLPHDLEISFIPCKHCRRGVVPGAGFYHDHRCTDCDGEANIPVVDGKNRGWYEEFGVTHDGRVFDLADCTKTDDGWRLNITMEDIMPKTLMEIIK